MSPSEKPRNLAASVRARLQNLAREEKLEFQLVLSEFAVERLLYRLSVSDQVHRFVLKGAMLFRVWTRDRLRATWDLDLLGRGQSDVPEVVESIREICLLDVEDGIEFDPNSIQGEEIRPTDEYSGVRIRLQARLADARIPVQIDVGFGDSVTPAPELEDYPSLLEHPAPRILAYPREAVVAEKLEAIVSLGVTNSRMKDFYDIHQLASTFSFTGEVLTEAIRVTFERRDTPFSSETPVALSNEYLRSSDRQAQWKAFLRRSRLDGPKEVLELADGLRQFLLPVLDAVFRDNDLSLLWPPGGPWISRDK